MLARSRRAAAVKFAAWAATTALVFAYAVAVYTSGALVRWYYYEATANGYAVDARSLGEATADRPVALGIGNFSAVDGARAVRVSAGDRLPEGATGVIDLPTVTRGDRVRLEGDRLVVLVPWELRESKGFMFRDGFAHKHVRANPWAGVWNLVMVMLMGLSLGYLAQSFTDLIGLRLQRSDHTVSR